MKFGGNGALRIGTRNGANPEIREEGDVENSYCSYWLWSSSETEAQRI
jgi:glucan phosphorylase